MLFKWCGEAGCFVNRLSVESESALGYETMWMGNSGTMQEGTGGLSSGCNPEHLLHVISHMLNVSALLINHIQIELATYIVKSKINGHF